MSALALDDVTVSYDGVRAVAEVSLALPRGEVLAVLGPSGCGKSTLLRAIAGLELLESGRVLFDGADLARVPTYRRGFAMMFQDGQLFSHLSVAANVAYPLRLRATPRAQAARRVSELLDLVGLPGYDRRDPATLSGGERQRVALARALAGDPRLLLLDEPLSALDGPLRERLATELRAILQATGTTAMCVTHDHDEAYSLADRLAVMRAGRVIQEGPIASVWRAPVDTETALFLGYARVLADKAAMTFRERVPIDALRATGDGGPRSAATRPAPAIALRRSALSVADRGPLSGTVTSARATPEVVRLIVEIAGIGEVDAVAPLRRRGASGVVEAGPAVGAEVHLAVDTTRLAVISTSLD